MLTTLQWTGALLGASIALGLVVLLFRVPRRTGPRLRVLRDARGPALPPSIGTLTLAPLRRAPAHDEKPADAS